MMAEMTGNKESRFVESSIGIHGHRYDYSAVVYRGQDTPVLLKCPVHGEFTQRPGNHIQGKGCKQCGADKIRRAKKSNREVFVKKATNLHKTRYDYSRVVYQASNIKVDIICPNHGSFWQTPNNHLMGRGCRSCGSEARSSARRDTTSTFIAKSQAVHGSLYDYSQANYRGSALQVTITCAKHGSFRQRPDNHLQGNGCPSCAVEANQEASRYTTEDFVYRATVVHNGLYSYGETVYTHSRDKVHITCKKHGVFEQEAAAHLTGVGCPSCVQHYTKGQKQIEQFLARFEGLTFVSNTRSVISPFELDIHIPEKQIAIEFNGDYWHSYGPSQAADRKGIHLRKYKMCRDKGIHLLQVAEHEWNDLTKKDIWKSIISSRLGMHRNKIHARATNFREITRETADLFLDEHHLQGRPHGVRWAFGLFSREELVGVITFSEHEKTQINLTRLAFPSYVTVVGGAQKLLKNSLEQLPVGDVVTFSDNRYSAGNVYSVIGFTKDADLPPSYQWFFRGQVYNKRRCRHKHLPKLLGDAYDPNQTEHENMYRAGARCLYDAGYQRWILRRTVELPYP